MTNAEAISLLKQALAEIEWTQPMQYAAAIDKAIEALEGKDKDVPTKWIRCKDRPPEVDVDVLTIANVTGEHIAMVDCITETGSWLLQGGDDLSQVTHWRYLPEPPKEGEK